jgi:hypothetical protein
MNAYRPTDRIIDRPNYRPTELPTKKDDRPKKEQLLIKSRVHSHTNMEQIQNKKQCYGLCERVLSICNRDLRKYLCSASKLRAISKHLAPLNTIRMIKFRSHCEMDSVLDLVMNRKELRLIDLSNHITLDDEQLELLIDIMPSTMKRLVLRRCFALYRVPNTSRLNGLTVNFNGSWKMNYTNRKLSYTGLVEMCLLALKSGTEEGMQKVLSFIGNVVHIEHQKMLLRVVRNILCNSEIQDINELKLHRKEMNEHWILCVHVPLRDFEYVVKFIIARNEH